MIVKVALLTTIVCQLLDKLMEKYQIIRVLNRFRSDKVSFHNKETRNYSPIELTLIGQANCDIWAVKLPELWETYSYCSPTFSSITVAVPDQFPADFKGRRPNYVCRVRSIFIVRSFRKECPIRLWSRAMRYERSARGVTESVFILVRVHRSIKTFVTLKRWCWVGTIVPNPRM